MKCNLGWNHTRDFKIEQARSVSSIWNHKYDFRPKLLNTRFNYHFITPILKSLKYRTWSVQIFFIDAVLSRFEIKFIHFLRGKNESLETTVAKFATWYSLSFKPWNLIGCFILSIASSLTGKKVRFKAKKVVRFRANQITGTTRDFKMSIAFFFCFFNRLFLRKAGGREVDIRSKR